MKFKQDFMADIDHFTGSTGRFSGLRLVGKLLSEPGLMFVLLARIQIALEGNRFFPMARLVHLANLRITGGEVGHGCSIGPGLVVKHPLGVVIGGGSEIGARCMILRNVTLGELRPDVAQAGRRYPTIGDDCMIGTGATVLGAITVGSNVRIGAHSVVLSSLPSGCTAVGAPAKIVSRANEPL